MVSRSDDEGEEKGYIAAKKNDESGTRNISSSRLSENGNHPNIATNLKKLANECGLSSDYEVKHNKKSEEFVPILFSHAHLHILTEKILNPNLKVAFPVPKPNRTLRAYIQRLSQINVRNPIYLLERKHPTPQRSR